MANQSVTNSDCVSAIKCFPILFRTLHVADFVLSHFAFYTRPGVTGAFLKISSITRVYYTISTVSLNSEEFKQIPDMTISIMYVSTYTS